MKPGSPNEVSHSYDESLKYDKNGNIKKLVRNGYLDSDSGQTVTIDNLDYSYITDTNMLSEVSDSTYFTNGFKDGNNSSEDYTYDSKGNMISDLNKGADITYNQLNLPTHIKITGGYINYRYDATGAKVQKTITINGLDSVIDYLWGYQYKDGVLQFFPTAEGYVQDVVDEAQQDNFNYVYNYTDHLGNVRLSYGKGNGSGLVTVMEENNYYPFGLKHENYNAQEYTYSIPPGLGGKTSPKTIDLEVTERKEYQYKYQGQERQDELGLNWDSFKWRNYDYAIGRFMSVDPLTEKYGYNGVYNFSENRVLDSRELEGLEAVRHTQIDSQGRQSHILEKSVVILIQSKIPTEAWMNKSELKKVNSRNEAITAKNVRRVSLITDDLTHFYKLDLKEGFKNAAGESVKFKINISQMEVNDITGKGLNLMTNRDVKSSISLLNGIPTSETDFDGATKISPATIFTGNPLPFGSMLGNTRGQAIDNVDEDKPYGTASHEFAHTLFLHDNDYNSGGIRNSPPKLPTSEEIEEMFKKSLHE